MSLFLGCIVSVVLAMEGEKETEQAHPTVNANASHSANDVRRLVTTIAFI